VFNGRRDHETSSLSTADTTTSNINWNVPFGCTEWFWDERALALRLVRT
jgi:hypothetical protein